MDQIPLSAELVWNVTCEHRCYGQQSVGYLLLLSALDSEWQIFEVELTLSSWAQAGCIYLITLRHNNSGCRQKLFLPCTEQVENLLNECTSNSSSEERLLLFGPHSKLNRLGETRYWYA
ncbi:MAG: hypothetical protein JXA13_11520 [Anaerolineales bacterium]|nr:hypothetical protein [Anaerolineales bacterium]